MLPLSLEPLSPKSCKYVGSVSTWKTFRPMPSSNARKKTVAHHITSSASRKVLLRVAIPDARLDAPRYPRAGASPVGNCDRPPFRETLLSSRLLLAALQINPVPLVRDPPRSTAPHPPLPLPPLRGSRSTFPPTLWPAIGGGMLPPRQGARPRFVPNPSQR